MAKALRKAVRGHRTADRPVSIKVPEHDHDTPAPPSTLSGRSGAQNVVDRERGRTARRRLLPRSHKPGGRKKPIVVSASSPTLYPLPLRAEVLSPGELEQEECV